MKQAQTVPKNIIFFYHKNHSDKYNGTSVYDKALLDLLSRNYNITAVEPTLPDPRNSKNKNSNAHYFVHLLKNVYSNQIRWLLSILRGKHLTSPQDTILLVEDVYSAPIPILVSKLKGYKMIFRAADFGAEYSKTLFEKHKIDSVIYSIFRSLLERLIIKNSSVIICPSSNVKNAIIRKFPESKCKLELFPYIRNSIDRNRGDNKSETTNPRDILGKVVLLFLGDFRYPPNQDAGIFLIKDVVPKLDDRLGKRYVMLIAGANSDRLSDWSSPNVKVLGPVEDLDVLMSGVHIGLAPMKTVGGLSMKVVDYLTHGLRVVATPEAASGIEYNDQMKLARLKDFAETVETEIIHAINNGQDFHKISDEVQENYMSEKWKANLLRKMGDINLENNT